MKKLAVLLFTFAMVVAFTLPVGALENQFSGYFRMRMVSQNDFSGTDAGANDEAQDYQGMDQRTRIGYTAKINDNLKLVNLFQIDAEWGRAGANASFADEYNADGDVGTDGVGIEIRHSYAEWTMMDGKLLMRVGLAPQTLARGFIVDDDFASVTAVWFGPAGFSLAGVYAKFYEGGVGNGANDYDLDAWAIVPSWTNDMITITPFWAHADSEDISQYLGAAWLYDVDQHFLGVEVGLKMDKFNLFGVVSYNFGDISSNNQDQDLDAWLFNLGGSVDLGVVEIHAESFYATGNDKDYSDTSDNDYESWIVAGGKDHGWSEIMGEGIFDQQASNGSCGADIDNIWAVNLGVNIKPMEKLNILIDLWYARHPDDRYGRDLTDTDGDGKADDVLGTEVDIVVTYELVEGLNLDLVGAYLFADEGTWDGADDADPWELGAQLSLKF